MKLTRLFSLPGFETEEQQRIAKIQLYVVLFFWTLGLFVLIINALSWQITQLTQIIILGYILHLLPLGLLFRKKLYISGFFLTALYTLTGVSIATIGGGLHDYVVMLFPINIMFASLIAKKRGLIYSSIMALAGIIWLAYGEMAGWFVITSSHFPDMTDLFIAIALILTLAWLVNLLITNSQYGLVQTWQELSARKQYEAEIHAVNEQLQKQLEEIQSLQEALHQQALRDSLTGLYNRHYLEEILPQETARAHRSGKPFSVAILDLDNLKTINDTYGHINGGDQAIKTLADTLKRISRKGDIVIRYAGDEFLVLLYDTPGQIALSRVHQWRKEVQKIRIHTEIGQYNISFSAGISEFSTSDTNDVECLIRADQALYQAKENGRNQVVLWSDKLRTAIKKSWPHA